MPTDPRVPLYLVDAFTDRPFAGNPAGVCLLPGDWPADRWMQQVAMEMNQAETAFVVRSGSEYGLRWFTPAVEVELCGHATLASAHALWSADASTPDLIRFHTLSGVLTAAKTPGGIELDFPVKPAAPAATPPGLLEALGAAAPRAVARNQFDYLVELASAGEVRALSPDVRALARVECRGVIVTAPGDDVRYDFVSRFFAPAVGVDEDPVTGSAHCCLADHWGRKLGKAEMVGYQASPRGGAVRVRRVGDRVKLGGTAVTVVEGTIGLGNAVS